MESTASVFAGKMKAVTDRVEKDNENYRDLTDSELSGEDLTMTGDDGYAYVLDGFTEQPFVV